ncbi:MAG: hypothetical protein K8S62_05670 [Candidatus Sabulitectum sp.]|nr:hypothetical protein [Candidatus Sabulitectum sp.]
MRIMSAMILTLLCVLCISDTVSGDLNTEEFGWIVVCEVLADETDAERLAEELGDLFVQYTGYLWIPDWASLSGYRGWQVFLGPFETSDYAAQVACFILWKYPDTYAIHVSSEEGKNTASPTPVDFSDFTGLMPPSDGFTLMGESPSDWKISWVSRDILWREELQEATKTLIKLPGWSVEHWMDCQIGTIEYRAVRESLEDPGNRYEQVSQFLRESANRIGISILESPGEFILIHKLPDRGRRSDLDFWVALTEETLEYGYRVRSTYGEMPYEWPFIPEEAHASAIPVLIHSYDEALDFLLERLIEDSVYRSSFPEDLSFGLEYLDNFPEDVYRDYYDIAIREVHRPGGPGDPNTAPIVDRFRIYHRGEIIWFKPAIGMFLPYEDILNR